jgi:3-phosphoglycerate kinase
MAKKSISDIDVSGKTVFMRVDFNVPLKEGRITNDKRIQAALPSIKAVLDAGGKLVLASHLGRPAGKGFEEDASLKPCADRLGELLGKTVQLGPQEVVGEAAEKMASSLGSGEAMLLENVRFCAGETMPDKAKKNPDKKLTAEQEQELADFSAALGRLGEVYVNDAFGTCHRKHASMFGAAQEIQKRGGPAVAGFLVEKEIQYLQEAVENPARPFVAILGGAKVSDKIKLISSLLEKVDRILIGGAMAYTLLKAQGYSVGDSLVEDDQVEQMKPLLESAGEKIMLPMDHVIAQQFDSNEARETPDRNIPEGMLGMDIGPKTVDAYVDEVGRSKTVVWNGPMGVFERDAFAFGTRSVAEAVASATDEGTISVIGGGDSATAVEQMGLEGRMTHVSTGGGASLTYLEGKPMPAIEVLDEK